MGTFRLGFWDGGYDAGFELGGLAFTVSSSRFLVSGFGSMGFRVSGFSRPISNCRRFICYLFYSMRIVDASTYLSGRVRAL